MNDIGGAPSASPCLALDIGASKVDVVDVDRDGMILARGRVDVTAHGSDLFDVMVEEVRDVLDGVTGNAGHIGHLNVVPRGALCSCGAFGCLEAEVSGRAIEARTGRHAVEADAATRQRTGELVGRAVGTLSSVLDFRHCYVAGSVVLGYGDEFFDVANKAARSVATMSCSHDIEIRPSQLGSDGPILGAVLIAWRGAQ